MPTRYPCGICLKPVAKNHKAVKCDYCDLWIHIKCFFFSIITLYTKNVKQIKNTINSAPITIYVVEGKLNIKKRKKKKVN